ncbi:hypothetical protein HWV62_16746 [Athelia sp. TMB]|nr:hypothetical protein HWV62_16746 [Athelia sp. TMB]
MSEERGNAHSSTSGGDADVEKHAEDPSNNSPDDLPPKPLTFFGHCTLFASDPRLQMTVIMIIGGLIMYAHHSLHHYLNGRLVKKTYDIEDHQIWASVKSVFRSQEVVSSLSNFIANCERAVLTMAIGIAFVQVLWMFLRRNQYSIDQIDKFMATQRSPFTISSIKTLFSSAFILTLMALCATAMTAVTVFAPSSLTIQPLQAVLHSVCTVPIVDVASADYGAPLLSGIGVSSWPGVAQLVARIIVQEQPFPPSSQFLTCGNTTCQYDIEFVAPTIQCTNATDSVDFKVTLPNHTTNATVDGVGLATVYNSTYAWERNGVVLNVSMVRGDYHNEAWIFQSPQAFACTANNATYGVTVQYNAGPLGLSTVSLNHLYEYDRLPGVVPSNVHNSTANQTIQMNSIVDAFASGLNGTITYDSKGYLSGVVSTAVQYSDLSAALIGNTNITDWSTIIPNLMQQTSLSLMSGHFDLYAGAKSISPYTTTCTSLADVYVYAQWRLLVTYGACIGGAMLCVILGLVAISANKRGEALGFRRLLESARVLFTDAPQSPTVQYPPPMAKLEVTPLGHFRHFSRPSW